MFCTKCGKELYDGDRFCAFCGAEVRAQRASKNDEVVFNPLFKAEAQKKTEEILKAAEEIKQKETENAKRETVAFDWNLDGFPTEHPKKTEDALFNWDSVLEKRTGRKVDENESFFVERIKPEPQEAAPGITAESEKELQDIGRNEAAEPPKWIRLNDKENEEHIYVNEEKVALLKSESKEKAKEDILSTEELEREIFGIFEDESNACEEQAHTDTAKATEKGDKDASAIPSKAAVFGTPSKDSKFYTFNQKSDEFEELLNRERERVRSMEDEYNRRLENMDYTWVPEVFKSRALHQCEDKIVRKDDTDIQENTAKNADEILVEVVQPQTPNIVDLTREYPHINIAEKEAVLADDQVKAEEENKAKGVKEEKAAKAVNEETKDETKKDEVKTDFAEKDKLRYSDIFPRVGAETADSLGTTGTLETEGIPQDGGIESGNKEVRNKNGDSSNAGVAAVFDEDEEEPVKKHTLLKVLIVILLIALVIEGAALAVRFFAPESKAAKMIDDAVFAVADIFVSGDSQHDGGDADLELDFDAEDSKDAYLSGIVAEKAANVSSIGAVKYNSDLTYESDKTHSFAEISNAEEFVDAEWADAGATYGEKLLEGVIKYYDGWIDTNQDEDLVGINTLEIGEIRTGENGFYVLCKVIYAAADGGELSQVQTVFVKISNGLMVINEIKEETF